MKFVVITIIEADSEEQAREVRNELAASLEDARESGELPSGSSFDTSEVMPCADTEMIRDARAYHCFDDEVKFDPDAAVSEADDANWIQAWVRCPRMES
ncbi:hypothetical protein [Herbaspirillum huttiense]|uniref:Uncharacterized protein n=1 Tax=Herbaspirillum huttiense subsp. lycopersici TaxID=3074428 RepID=A0ABU2EFT2_9BURK|nr:hypothetical protein [Herbaspirillum huttiense]MDR9846985.1 hypothetical protein [Herbaspirillum huttiense SE1]